MAHDLLAMAFDNSPRRSDPAVNQNVMNRAIEIGLDPYQDSKLFWIAEQSLKAKLPDEWMECTTEEGQVYYFNLRNEDSTWEHPALDHYRQLYAKVKRQQATTDSPVKGSPTLNEPLPEISVTPRDTTSKGSGKEAWSVDKKKESPRVTKKSPRGSKESPRGNIIKPSTSTASSLLDASESPRLVAAHALKQKRDAEKLGGDAAFWRSRYELKETEVDTLAKQVHSLEKDLQVNLLQGARLVDENHKLKHLQDDNAGKLRVKSTTVLKHLAKRGFKIDPRRGVGDVDITSAVDDMIKVVDAHIEVDEGDRDENGFSLNFDGALARIKKELDYCFTYQKDSYTVDSVELKVKVEDVVQMAISFGEYLCADDRENYISRFLDHVISSGKENTMVPLEIITKSIEKQKPIEGRPDILLDSPLVVANLRKELQEEKESSKALGIEVEQKKHEIEVMHTKLMGLQARLEDTQGHEELLATKFSALSDAIASIKSDQTNGGRSGGAYSQAAADAKTLQKQVSSLNSQLDISNKRAADAERRLEDYMHKESDMRSDLTKLELNLRLKLDKKKAVIVELQDQKVDLEKVSKELYDELQNALMVSSRLESDNSQLQDIIDEYRAGDASIAVVRERLEIEYEINKKLKESVANFDGEIARYENTNLKLSELNEKLELDTIEYREELAGMKSELARQTNRARVLQDDNQSLVETVRDLKLHIVKLNDMIVEIKGNIRVFARVRPLFVDEIKNLDVSQADLDGLVRYPDYNLLDFNSTPFEFDRVFNPSCDQEDIYEEVEPFIRAVMTGCRVCVFAYGQTGSGKSHTMEGPDDNKGVNYRALKSLLDLCRGSEEFKTDVHVSMLEVYNESIRDLLSMETSVDDTLDIRVGKQGVYVDMLSEWPVRCIEEAVSIFDRGIDNREMASNKLNERSSRSHMVVIVKVHRVNIHNGTTSTGYLYLVDLAGSERVKLTSVSGKRLREAQNINKSLGALGDVIAAMASGHKHVPYRNSKLTFLLQDALKESSKVLMFVNIHPSPVHTSESFCSLQFASRVRSVQLGRPKKEIAYGSK